MSTHGAVPTKDSNSVLNVQTLQEAAKGTFSHPIFRHVCWAGIFSSVAKGTSHENSDVDVVVIAGPEDPSLPKNAPFLYEALPRVWGRPVDVVSLKEGQTDLRGFIQLEALLSSHTIYLRDDQARANLTRLRLLASNILDEGHHLFTHLVGRIHEVRKLADGLSWEEFQKLSHAEHDDAFDQVYSVLVLLDIEPPHHPIHEAFWLVFLEEASDTRQRLDPYAHALRGTEAGLDEQALGILWMALTSKGDGLEYLARVMSKLVLPALEETLELKTSIGDTVEP